MNIQRYTKHSRHLTLPGHSPAQRRPLAMFGADFMTMRTNPSEKS